MQKQLATILAASLAVLGFASTASAAITSLTDIDGTPYTRVDAGEVVTSSVTFGGATFPCPVILEGFMRVGDGGNLTIIPGCIVRGQGRNAAGAAIGDQPGTLVVERGGFATIDGSASNPITFTTAAVDVDGDGDPDRQGGAPGFLVQFDGSVHSLTNDMYDQNPTTAPLAPLYTESTNATNYPNISLWGGMVIVGRAPSNDATLEFDVEGVESPPATACGNEPHDSSGVYRYMSVRHAGDEIEAAGSANELNGITIACVGDGTVMEYIEVALNFDDGVEFFGGTVNLRNYVAFGIADDSIDTDKGYTGSIQNALVIHPWWDNITLHQPGTARTPNDGDELMELDGIDSANVQATTGAPWPFPSHDIWNATLIGDAVTRVAGSNSSNIELRASAATNILNSIIVDTSSGVPWRENGSGLAGFQPCDNIAFDEMRVVATSTNETPAAGCHTDYANNGDAAVADGEYTLAGPAANAVNRLGVATPLLVDADCSFTPLTGTVAAGGACDPRTIANGDQGVVPTDKGLDRSATHRGAFPANQPLWTAGWSYVSQAGIVVDN